MQKCSYANLLWFHSKGSAVHFTACASLDWPARVTIPGPAFCDALEAEAPTVCNPVAYADRGSKGTPLAHFFPLFLWTSKEIGRGVLSRKKSKSPESRLFYQGYQLFKLKTHDSFTKCPHLSAIIKNIHLSCPFCKGGPHPLLYGRKAASLGASGA